MIDSPGGMIAPAVDAYGLIRALPAKVNTYAQSLVASAATLLFLSGQEREASRDARFQFHPSQTLVSGMVNEQQFRDELAAFFVMEGMVAQIYHDRTKLTDADIQRFSREAVVYTAEQAEAVGVVQEVADLHIPGDGQAKILLLE